MPSEHSSPDAPTTSSVEDRRDRPGAWRRRPASDLPPPIDERAPYVEAALDHAGLTATRLSGSFWPAVLPYSLDGDQRVVYWRDDLADADLPTVRAGWCATPDALHVARYGDAIRLDLAPVVDGGRAVAVDATVAGETTTALVAGYRPPRLALAELTPHAAEFAVDGDRVVVPAGETRTLELATRTVNLLEAPGESGGRDGQEHREGGDSTPGVGDAVEVTPTLRVRYPGHRRVVHPAPGVDYLVFPSFGVDLADSGRVPVDPDAADLDVEAVATVLGVDLDARPYAERVLWEAFAYAAFDPGREAWPVDIATIGERWLALPNPPASLQTR